MWSRIWVRGWLASIVVHVGVVILIHRAWTHRDWTRPSWDSFAPLPQSQTLTLTLTPTSRPAETIEFVFLDSPPSKQSIAAAASGSIATRSSESSPSLSPSSTPGSGTGTMKMRGPEMHPGDDQLARIADAPGHEPPPPPLPSKRLDDAPGGGSVIHDTVTTISVDRDGTAHLHDKPDIEVNFDANPLHFWRGLKSFGRGIADWAEDPTAGARVGPSQDLSAAQRAVPGNCDHFGDTMCSGTSDAPVSQQNGVVGIPILSGKFDETSFLMRKLGVGDAFAARKLKALDDTRTERAERGARYKQTQLDHSAQLMQANLQRVWAVTRNVDERKVALFELWDECTEDDAGDRARTMVIGWIRANLPQDKPGAYTTPELAVLAKQRTSKAPFTPYEESPR
jgi:hypothetical protein